MFLHKYIISDVGTLFLLSGKRNPGKLNFNLPSTGFESITEDSVKNSISILKGKFTEEPLPPEEEKKEVSEEKKETPEKETEAPEKVNPDEPPEKEDKAALASMIRQFAKTLKD